MIIERIYNTMQEVLKEEKEINKAAFIAEIMVSTGCAKRTAVEYFETAKAKILMDEDKMAHW